MPKKTSDEWTIGSHSIRVTSLHKRYWPDEGLTKGDTLDYYRRVASTMLPYLRGRPVTLRVYPNGIDGPGFWRRDRPDHVPDWLRAVRYQPETRQTAINVPLIDDEAGLVWYVDHSAIELHQWMSRADHLEQPDWAVFDLDPGKNVGFDRVLEAALLTRDELANEELKCYAKTSGATGMHIFVPLASEYSYEMVREWVHGVARRLEECHPETIAVASGGTHNRDVVTIDHAQNSIARNTAAPYTLRALPGAPVSTPVTWNEVQRGKVRPDHFTLRTVPARLERHGDPWTGSLEQRQPLPISS